MSWSAKDRGRANGLASGLAIALAAALLVVFPTIARAQVIPGLSGNGFRALESLVHSSCGNTTSNGPSCTTNVCNQQVNFNTQGPGTAQVPSLGDTFPSGGNFQQAVNFLNVLALLPESDRCA